jgi:Tfp pilus assembly protein PilZ
VRIPLAVGEAGSEMVLMTEDISYSGVFLRTDSVRPRGEVIRLEVDVPDTKETLTMHAMVAHCITWDKAAQYQQGPGWGLQLQGTRGETLKQWNGFVGRAMALHDARTLDDAAAIIKEVRDLVEPIRRQYPRRSVRFEVQVKTVDDLFDMLTKDISSGGAFLLTDQILPEETALTLTFIHPLDGSELDVAAKVVRVVPSPPGHRGLGVLFVRSATSRWMEFESFIRGAE